MRYANNKPVGVENIKFIDLEKMKKGKTCTFSLYMSYYFLEMGQLYMLLKKEK